MQFGSILDRLAFAARAALTVVAAAVVAWSFWRVGARIFLAERAGPGVTEITVLHWGDRDEGRIVANLVASFEAANPDIRVKRIHAGGGAAYFSKLQTMIASGHPPDVFFLNGYMLPKYVPAGILKDVEPFLKRDAAAGTLPFALDDMIPEALDGFRYDGEQLGLGPLYGVPMSFTPMGFYYNIDLFKQAGVALPTAAWTWHDFEKAAEQITARTGTRGAAIDLRGSQLLRLMLWAEGTDLTDPEFRTVNADDPRLKRALERIGRWRDRPEVYRLFGAAEESLETSTSAFVSGDAAMQGIAGRWMVPTYAHIEDFEWGWAPLPRPAPVVDSSEAPDEQREAARTQGAEARSPRPNMLYIAAWCIAEKSEHPEAAWRLAKHFASPEGQRINSELGLALPTLWSVARGPAFMNPDVLPRDDGIFLEAVPGATPMLWPTASRAQRAMTNIVYAMFSSGREPPDVALARLQHELDATHSSKLLGEFPAMPWRAVTGAIAAAGLLAAGIGGARWWRRRPGALARRREIAGLLMVSPYIAGLALFVAGPVLLSLLLSVCKWSGMETLDKAEFVGLGNYVEAFANDSRFGRSLLVTAFYALLAVPLGQVAALLAAMLMNARVPGINFFRSAWYLPTVLAGVAMAVMWWSVFDTEHGLANSALAPAYALFGVDPIAWFGTDARPFGVVAFALASVWTFGGTMLIYLAGLTAIPGHLYEAARIDGAGALSRFRNVTLPMLSPVILFNVIIAIIASFQVFTQAFIMTRGGPNDATLFYVLLLYFEAFESHNMGYASALAWVLLAVVLVLTVFVMRLARKRVHYEGAAL